MPVATRRTLGRNAPLRTFRPRGEPQSTRLWCRLLLRPPRHPRPLSRVRYNSCEGESMKRPSRIIFKAITLLSLMLCVATAALWVRSYWVLDSVRFTLDRGNCYGVDSNFYEAGSRPSVVAYHPQPLPRMRNPAAEDTPDSKGPPPPRRTKRNPDPEPPCDTAGTWPRHRRDTTAKSPHAIAP